MPRTTLKSILSREIEVLNKRIDRKIQRGRSYYKDSLKHQALLVQYRRMEARKERCVSIGSLISA